MTFDFFKEGERDYINTVISDLMDNIDGQSDLYLKADKALKILDGELSLQEYKVFVQDKTDAQADAEIQASKNAWNNLYVAGTIDKDLLEFELKKLE